MSSLTTLIYELCLSSHVLCECDQPKTQSLNFLGKKVGNSAFVILFWIFQIKGFRDYVELYIKNKTDDSNMPLKIVYENVNDRWEVAITQSEKGFQQASFVNSIATTKVCLFRSRVFWDFSKYSF
jgi:hypothetical protein